MSQLNGMVLYVQFARVGRLARGAVIGVKGLGSRWDGDIDTNGVVVGLELLAMIGNRMDRDVGGSCISAGVTWD